MLLFVKYRWPNVFTDSAGFDVVPFVIAPLDVLLESELDAGGEVEATVDDSDSESNSGRRV